MTHCNCPQSLHRIRLVLSEIIEFISAQIVLKDNEPVNDIIACPKRAMLEGFKYRTRGGFPLLNGILKRYGRRYNGDLNDIACYSANRSTGKVKGLLRDLSLLGLISCDYVYIVDAIKGITSTIVNIEITEKGCDWVKEREER